ncbi:MAG: YbaB/EbfC family nucleoid-associated protein [Pseudomonadota bacterium]
MFKGMGGLGDMAGMMAKAGEMKKRMEEAQASFEVTFVDGTDPAEHVKATVNVKGVINNIQLADSAGALESTQLEAAIVEAVKEAQTKGQAMMAAEIAKISEDLGLPPGLGLPGT